MAIRPDIHEDAAEFYLHGTQIPELVAKSADPKYIRKYSRFFRKLDRAMLRLFSDLEVIDNSEIPLPVPILVGTVERAVAAIFGDTSRFPDSSGQFTSVRLPMATIVPGDPIPDFTRFTWMEAKKWGPSFSERRGGDTRYGFTRGLPINRPYTLVFWTRYVEDFNQLSEIVLLKFAPIAEIRIPDNIFPSDIILESFNTNFSEPPPEKDIKIYKAEIQMTVQTYLPQPIKRARTILQSKTEIGVGNPQKIGGFDKSGEVFVSVDPNNRHRIISSDTESIEYEQ